MNKYIIILSCIISSFTTCSLSAQIITGNIIDCSAVPFRARRTTAFSERHDEKSETNRLPTRFMIAKQDANSGNKMTWNDANTACKNYTEGVGDKGSWRLPTQREAGVLTVIRSNLKLPITPFSTVDKYNDYYWCSTQASYPLGYHWTVCHYVNGIIGNFADSSLYRARCVKDY